jgi:hypothetical protein
MDKLRLCLLMVAIFPCVSVLSLTTEAITLDHITGLLRYCF